MSGTQLSSHRSILLFSFLVGLAANASITGLINSIVPFTVFSWLTLGLALYCLYTLYSKVQRGTESQMLAMCLVGIFGYTVGLRTIYPELGSNFFALMLTLGLLFWLSHRSGVWLREPKS
ncbi:DUF1422 family protein [Thaumasiovibrio sp. DFM-14]|uniref:DUF1422 family protein n=1 Tax=Thaumasiovibrio sp. DFM-14 TaxID=3384792 RepID=UPI0039A32F5E